MQEEAAEANRRLADVLLSINSADRLESFRQSRPTAPVSTTASRINSAPNAQRNTKNAAVPDPFESSEEAVDEYSNDFEESQDNDTVISFLLT